MTRGHRPHQPRPRPPAGESGSSTTRYPPEETSGTVRVKVNDDSKVSELDGERYEPVPTGGGRFSAWRRRLQQEERTSSSGHGVRELSPEQRRSRRRRRAGIGALVALVLALVMVWVVYFSPFLAVRSIEVEGARLTDAQEVQDHLSRFEGVPMTRISEREVMDSLGSLPQVRSVHVLTMPDNRLVVQLTERVPVAAVSDGDGWALVDQEGTQLRTVAQRSEVGVPVIEGGTDVLGSEDFATVADVLSTLPAALLEQVDSARVESNSTVRLELDGGVAVRWGDATRSGLKAEVLAQLVEASEQTGPVGVYDVSSPEHPVLE